ncbi:hypothetical protein [Algoriphagus sp.]|uniref:hypothetical protein n=1 Tax=Algoriphagus sp. TaxID=1872435 RepID=UPI00391BD97C
MNSLPSNTGFQPPIGNKTPTYQVTTQSHYRRRDTHVKIYPNHLGRNTQAIFQSSQMDDQHHTATSKSGQKDLTKKSQAPKVSDPNGIKPDDREHLPEDDKEIDPNKEIPEEDNSLEDEDGSIIKEPTREVDDPYLPGHGTEENTPSTEEEFPKSDPKENIETDF